MVLQKPPPFCSTPFSTGIYVEEGFGAPTAAHLAVGYAESPLNPLQYSRSLGQLQSAQAGVSKPRGFSGLQPLLSGMRAVSAPEGELDPALNSELSICVS